VDLDSRTDNLSRQLVLIHKKNFSASLRLRVK
jgi:hypothetical protein